VSGASGKRVTAGAMHADLAVAGMDGCFHVSSETSIQPLDSTGVRKDSARQAISCQFCGAYLSIKSLQLEEVDQNRTKPVLPKTDNSKTKRQGRPPAVSLANENYGASTYLC
jgi:hypothetical protein